MMYGTGLSAIALPRTSADRQIEVRSSAVKNGILLVEAELNGNREELSCFATVETCKAPAPETYLIRPATEQQSLYQDCQNVALYQKATDQTSETLAGIYCGLDDGKDWPADP